MNKFKSIQKDALYLFCMMDLHMQMVISIWVMH